MIIPKIYLQHLSRAYHASSLDYFTTVTNFCHTFWAII